jgi:hypothetical protein
MPPSHGSKRQRTVGSANAVRSQKKRKLCKCVECCAELAGGVRWLEREYYRHRSQSRGAPSAAAAADDGPDDDHGGGGHESDEWCSDAGELASGEDLGQQPAHCESAPSFRSHSRRLAHERILVCLWLRSP